MDEEQFDKLSEHDALMTELTAEQLRKIYLPKNFATETFKAKDLIFLEMAFERGAILAHNRENYKRKQENQSLLKEQLKWISVDDKLPIKKFKTDRLSYRVLTLQQTGDSEVSFYDYELNMWALAPHHSKVTHWMYLPDSPTK